MAKILVTGGLGFIGSHTVVELQNAGYTVVIIDDLSNATEETLDRIVSITNTTPEFEKIDLKVKHLVDDFFKRHADIEGVIHFAAYKSVEESVREPLMYYQNNINSLTYVLDGVSNLKTQNFIFSSSCTVYGQAEKLPIAEDAPVQAAESPYGNTKQIGEEILKDLAKADSNFKAISLRYFNPIGAHESAKIGELPIGVPQNLVPFITQTAIGIREQLLVFGGDYDTKDGTCIRDYIHVVDIAKAHVIALERLLKNKQSENYEFYNLGTGKGSTVLDVIKSFERVSGTTINYTIVDKRPGDVMEVYSGTTKANNVLGWKAEKTLDEAMLSAWQWEQFLRNNS